MNRLLALILILGTSLSSAFAQEPALTITHLTGSFYVYTTYKDLGGTPFPSNSLYVVTRDGVVLIDTPWDPEQTLPLLDSIERRHRMPVVMCLVTHYHDDRTAGLDVLRDRGVMTYASRMTDSLAAAHGDRRAEHLFARDTSFRVGGVRFETYHPGEGHTRDNIVVWFPKARVLFGGCLVKSTQSAGLGNVADANVDAWPRTIRNVMRKYPRRRHVIPGHYGWSRLRSLEHTLHLLRKAR